MGIILQRWEAPSPPMPADGFQETSWGATPWQRARTQKWDGWSATRAFPSQGGTPKSSKFLRDGARWCPH